MEVAHTVNEEAALELVEMIKERFGVETVDMYPLSLSISCHIVGSLAVACSKDWYKKGKCFWKLTTFRKRQRRKGQDMNIEQLGEKALEARKDRNMYPVRKTNLKKQLATGAF